MPQRCKDTKLHKDILRNEERGKKEMVILKHRFRRIASGQDDGKREKREKRRKGRTCRTAEKNEFHEFG